MIMDLDGGGPLELTTGETRHSITRSAMRELRTALDVWRRAEYTGGRERAAQFMATVIADALVDYRDEPKPAEAKQ